MKYDGSPKIFDNGRCIKLQIMLIKTSPNRLPNLDVSCQNTPLTLISKNIQMNPTCKLTFSHNYCQKEKISWILTQPIQFF